MFRDRYVDGKTLKKSEEMTDVKLSVTAPGRRRKSNWKGACRSFRGIGKFHFLN